LSDTPEKNHPWAKFRAVPGGSPPPKAGPPQGLPRAKAIPLKTPVRPTVPNPPAAAPLPPPARPEAPGSSDAAATQKPVTPAPAGTVVSDDLAAALNKLAVEYAAPTVTSAPFITAMQREVEARERKRESRRQLIKLGILAACAVIGLHITITRVLYRTPSVEALTATVETLPDALLPLYSTARQPLQPGSVFYTETDRVSANRIRYAAEVTLRLRKPLYVPAVTNGTAAYRQLQESLLAARQRELKFNLFPPGEGPTFPDLPMLIQVSHRAGDTVVIRVPFEARRFAWTWRIDAPLIALRSVNRTLAGDSIELYQGVPHLIFGAAGSMAEVRLLMRQARVYIVAVAQEIQKHADVQAIVEKPSASALDPNAPAVPAAGDPAADPANKPALSLDELRKLFDPNAPAVDQPAAPTAPDPTSPAVDPNAPAADPNAPAVRLNLPDKPAAPPGKK
jgi:hypothetical protein